MLSMIIYVLLYYRIWWPRDMLSESHRPKHRARLLFSHSTFPTRSCACDVCMYQAIWMTSSFSLAAAHNPRPQGVESPKAGFHFGGKRPGFSAQRDQSPLPRHPTHFKKFPTNKFARSSVIPPLHVFLSSSRQRYVALTIPWFARPIFFILYRQIPPQSPHTCQLVPVQYTDLTE